MFGLLPENTELQMTLPRLAHLSLGPLGTLSSDRIELICSLTSLTFLKFSPTLSDEQALIPTALTQLDRLQELHADFVDLVPADLTKLASLRVLSVSPSPGNTHDLSGFTQLTFLKLNGGHNTTYCLPSGQSVHLQRLEASVRCTVQNLSDATALTYLELMPREVEQLHWPTTLQQLQYLKLIDYFAEQKARLPDYRRDMEVAIDKLPLEWQHYSNLVYLRLPSVSFQDELPLWLTTLGKLTELDMPRSTFYHFPERLLQLTQLEVLNLEHFNSHLDKVVGFAKMPALRYFDFGYIGSFEGSSNSEVFVYHYCQDEMQRLDLLAAALEARPLKLQKVRHETEAGTPPYSILTFAEHD